MQVFFSRQDTRFSTCTDLLETMVPLSWAPLQGGGGVGIGNKQEEANENQKSTVRDSGKMTTRPVHKVRKPSHHPHEKDGTRNEGLDKGRGESS